MLKNNKILKGFLVLLMGSGLAQFITVIISPVLTRIYTPDEFGIFTMFTSIILILGPLSALKLENAIVIEKNNKARLWLIALCFNLVAIISIISLIIIILFGKEILILLNVDTFYLWVLYTVPIGVAFTGINIVLLSIANYYGDYRLIAKNNVQRSIIVGASQIVYPFLWSIANGLIVGQILGRLLVNFKLIQNYKEITIRSYKSFSIFKAKILVKRHKDLILYASSQSFMNNLVRNSIPFVLLIIFSQAVVGLYGLAFKIIELPFSMINNELRKVFLKQFSEMNNVKMKHELRMLLSKSTLLLLFGSLLLSLPLYFMLPGLFESIFGVEWSLAGIFASYLLFWNIARLSATPSLVLLQVIKKQRIVLISEVIFSAILFTTLILFRNIINSAELIILYISLAYVIFYAVITFIAMSKVKGD